MKTIQDNWPQNLNWISLLAGIFSVFMVILNLEIESKVWIRFGYTTRKREFSKQQKIWLRTRGKNNMMCAKDSEIYYGWIRENVGK